MPAKLLRSKKKFLDCGCKNGCVCHSGERQSKHSIGNKAIKCGSQMTGTQIRRIMCSHKSSATSGCLNNQKSVGRRRLVGNQIHTMSNDLSKQKQEDNKANRRNDNFKFIDISNKKLATRTKRKYSDLVLTNSYGNVNFGLSSDGHNTEMIERGMEKDNLVDGDTYMENLSNLTIIGITRKVLMRMLEYWADAKWYEVLTKLEVDLWNRSNCKQQDVVEEDHANQIDDMEMTSLFDFGRSLLKRFCKLFQCSITHDSDEKWLRSVADSEMTNKSINSSSIGSKFIKKVSKCGTLGDKAAALLMLLQQNCVFNCYALVKLLRMLNKKGRREVILANEHLQNAFLDNLLPNRKLTFFHQKVKSHPSKTLRSAYFTSRNATDKHPDSSFTINIQKMDLDILQLFLLWSFEDFLKTAFASYIQLLGKWQEDSLEFVRQKTLKTLNELFNQQPEQEAAILGLIVSRLGDKSAKVCSSAVVHLSNLILTHPKMKCIIVKYVANYVSDCLIRPINNSNNSNKLMRQNSYFYRYRNSENKSKQREYYKKNQIFCHNLYTFAAGIYRGLLFLSEIHYQRHTNDETLASDLMKFYLQIFGILSESLVYDKKKKKHIFLYENIEFSRIMSALLRGMHRSLIYMDEDKLSYFSNEKNIDAIYRMVHMLPTFNAKIPLLSLLHSILKSANMISDRYYRLLYGQLMNINAFDSSKKVTLLLLILKILHEDTNVCRIASFFKRILQMMNYIDNPGFTVIVLKMLYHFCSERHSLLALINTPESQLQDSEELFKDICVTEEDEGNDGNRTNKGKYSAFENKFIDQSNCCKYDPFKREPKYCKADETYLWEVLITAVSYHPSIAEEARKLCEFAFKKNNLNTVNKIGRENSKFFFQMWGKDMRDIFNYHSFSLFLDKVTYNLKFSKVGQGNLLGTSEDFENKLNKGLVPYRLNSTKLWQNNKNVHPSDKWFSMYFNDAFVRDEERRKAQRAEKISKKKYANEDLYDLNDELASDDDDMDDDIDNGNDDDDDNDDEDSDYNDEIVERGFYHTDYDVEDVEDVHKNNHIEDNCINFTEFKTAMRIYRKPKSIKSRTKGLRFHRIAKNILGNDDRMLKELKGKMVFKKKICKNKLKKKLLHKSIGPFADPSALEHLLKN